MGVELTVLDVPRRKKRKEDFISKMADLVPFSPMIAPSSFGTLAAITVLLGFLASASFFVYEVTSNKYTRDIKKEFTAAAIAAGFDGLAVLFVFLAAGLYV